MHPKRAACILKALLLSVVALHSTAASAQPKRAPSGARDASGGKSASALQPLASSLTGMAKAEYEAGRILYQDGDYANALVKFQRAYELSRDPRLLWNMAACEKGLRRYAKVLEHLKGYLKEAGAMLTEQDRRDADELMKTIASLVSPLRIDVSEPGADVYVDDDKVGVSPLPGAVLVDAGKRRIRVSKPGFRPFEQSQTIVSGVEATIAIALEKDVHRGRLVVEAGPTDMIFLDGKAVGRSRWEGSVVSGGHTLRVSAPGMITYQSDVLIQDGRTRRVPIVLEPGSKSTNWDFWLVGGGVVITAGALIGGIFLTKNTASSNGTLGGVVFPTAITNLGGLR